MNIYFEFLLLFLLVFAVGGTIAYLPGVLKMKGILKGNLLFLLSFLLVALLFDISIKHSYLLALGFIYVMFNLYILFAGWRKGRAKIGYAVADFVLCSLTLFLSTCIVAVADDLPVRPIIYERFADGGYSFSPGNLDAMVMNSVVFAFICVGYKCLYDYLLGKLEERQNQKIEFLKLQKKRVETQFEALQSKVNPHFLYNSLNSIAGLATVDGEKTRQMAVALSRFFRYSMNREHEMMIPLREEVEMVLTYLEIEQIRFGDLLRYTVCLPEELASYKIPRMLLQPIVENCIKHGLKGNISALTVCLSFSVSGNRLLLSVKDDGAPFPANFTPGYGIQSVYQKLDLLCNRRYSVELRTEPEKDFRIYLNLLE